MSRNNEQHIPVSTDSAIRKLEQGIVVGGFGSLEKVLLTRCKKEIKD